MTNKIYKLLIIALLLIGGNDALKAQGITTGSCGPNATYTIEEGGVLTISGTGEINASAFEMNMDITSVVIEDGITAIGDNAFNFCTKLRTVHIPESVISIGKDAFYQSGKNNMMICLIANDELSIGDYAFSLSVKSSVSFVGTKTPTLGNNAFKSNATIYLPANYNGGESTAFGSATVKMIAESDAEASVTFSNDVVIYFETLSDAFIGATSSQGSTIRLLRDVENIGGEMSGISEVTFDLNGKNMTMNENKYIRIDAGTNLTITGNGKITYSYEPTKAPGATNSYIYSLYAPINVITTQNSAGVAEIVIGGNVVIETTDDLTAVVSVGSNESTSLARLIVKDNAKLISNNPDYIISYDSPASSGRVGISEVVVEGGIFENKAGGYAVGYYDDTYAKPDQHYHAYIGAEGATVDPKMENVYYGLSHDLPSTAGTVTFSENGVLRNERYYFADGETVSFTVNTTEGTTIESVKLEDIELIANEGAYSFTMPEKPSNLVFTIGSAEITTYNIIVNLDGGSLTNLGLAILEEYKTQYGIEVIYDVTAGTLSADIPEGTEVEINISKGDMYVTKANHTLVGFSDSSTEYTENTTITVTESMTYTLLWEENENTLWSFEDNTLTISGIGAMNDYEEGETPWNEYNEQIEVVVVEGGVTHIGNNAFNATSATEIFFYGVDNPTLGINSIPVTADIYVPTLDAWNDIDWNNVNYMPTFVGQQTTDNGQQTSSTDGWVGLAEGQTEPGAEEHVAINAALVLGQQTTDNGQQTSSTEENQQLTANSQSLSVKSFGYCGDGTTTNGSITIEDGGQLYCEIARGDVTVKREIIGYAGQQSTDNGQQSSSTEESQQPTANSQSSTKWYTISSPLKDTLTIIPNSSFLIPNSDLYRYDEPTFTWQNAKPGEGSTNFQTLDPGRGYLYANAENTTLEFKGNINTETVTYKLTAKGEKLRGFHLIGNPFTHDIKFSNLSASEGAALANGYYILNGDGAWGATLGSNAEDVIKPGQGALIKTTADGELAIANKLSAKRSQQTTDNGQQSLFSLSVTNGKHSDRAFVVFDKGVGLDKINHENENIPLLYIPMEDADYAIAMMDENVNEIPVNFETNVMGQYTISLRQENCNLEGMYLLDKETGEKVNILEEDYTFMAMSGDNAERFVLAKDNGQQTTDNGHFAYINNGEIVIFDIEGDAKIRIVDALGRCVYNGEAADETNRISASGFANGVYVIEKTDDKGIKVQKMIL